MCPLIFRLWNVAKEESLYTLGEPVLRENLKLWIGEQRHFYVQVAHLNPTKLALSRALYQTLEEEEEDLLRDLQAVQTGAFDDITGIRTSSPEQPSQPNAEVIGTLNDRLAAVDRELYNLILDFYEDMSPDDVLIFIKAFDPTLRLQQDVASAQDQSRDLPPTSAHLPRQLCPMRYCGLFVVHRNTTVSQLQDMMQRTPIFQHFDCSMLRCTAGFISLQLVISV